MIGLTKSASTRGRAPAGTSRDRAAEIYQRYGAALYTQALLMLGNERMAEQVACDVIAEGFTAPRCGWRARTPHLIWPCRSCGAVRS
jgi:hypothetical protein